MRNIHIPIWLGSAPKPRASTFVLLFSLVVATRTGLITIVPLRALEFLSDAQAVSVLYLCVSIFGVMASLTIPWLVHRLRRRWVFTLGCCCGLLAAVFMSSGSIVAFICGMIFPSLFRRRR